MYKSGVVIGKFMPLHKGHLHMLEFAKNSCKKLTILVDHLVGETIPVHQRVQALKESFPDANITVKGISRLMPQEPKEDPLFWNIWEAEILENTPDDLDVIVGAMDYIKDLSALLKTDFLMIDKQRSFVPISATDIRDNPMKNWKYLAPASKKLFVKKVVVVGGESTGKTTLTKALAEHYKTVWVPEYARTAIEEDEKCDLSTFRKIVNGQSALLQAMTPHCENSLLFCDTDLLATKVWLEKMYPEHQSNINQDLYRSILEQRADLYVLTNNDVDWEKDDVRFYPENEDREWFMEKFENELKRMDAPYIKLTSKTLSDRKKEVITEVDRWFS